MAIKMTDKELRKLSRLELLELILEVGKENSRLKEEIGKLKAENKTAQSIEALSAATRQVENALIYANTLTDTLQSAPREGFRVSNVNDYYGESTSYHKKSDSMSDREIYRRILSFFAKNDDKLDVFPDDIENDVRNRINSILNK